MTPFRTCALTAHERAFEAAGPGAGSPLERPAPPDPEDLVDASRSAELVAAAAAGDSAAWARLVDGYAGLVWSVIRGYRLSGDDAADVSQTTWLRLVEQLPRLREPERVGGWLATTARRECLRVLRVGSREQATDSEVLELTGSDQPESDAGLVRAETAEVLWRCYEDIPDRCQRLLRVLMTDPPPAYTEVAAALDMPVGSIGPTRRRCLEHLRRRLALDGVDADL